MSWRSPLPDLDVPSVDFSSCVLERGRRLPHKTALIDVASDRRITFGELTGEIDRVASGLLGLGLQRGEVVAICGFNTPEYVLAAHAVWRAGGVVVTVNPLFTVREMQDELADAGARLLLADAAVLDRAREAAHAAGIQHLHELGAESLRKLGRDQAPPTLDVDPNETALILYSS